MLKTNQQKRTSGPQIICNAYYYLKLDIMNATGNVLIMQNI